MDLKPDQIDLTILLSFPRSGSNFLQNIVKSNSTGVHCTSVYAAGKFLRPRALLKSHAVNEAALSDEMLNTWERTAPRNGTIILQRDPRDVMISYFDFLQTVFTDEVSIENFFEHDFNQLHAEYARRVITKEFRPLPDRANKDRPICSAADALKEWHRYWKQVTQNTQSLYLDFETLIHDPKHGFDTVMDYLDLPKPDRYIGLDTMVSQHGDSTRVRGKAGGWRNAPSKYTPIIDGTMERLGADILQMGYSKT